METVSDVSVEMQEIFCECNGRCGKMVTIPVTKFLEVINNSIYFCAIVAIDCPTPLVLGDVEIERGAGYIVYKKGS